MGGATGFLALDRSNIDFLREIGGLANDVSTALSEAPPPAVFDAKSPFSLVALDRVRVGLPSFLD